MLATHLLNAGLHRMLHLLDMIHLVNLNWDALGPGLLLLLIARLLISLLLSQRIQLLLSDGRSSKSRIERPSRMLDYGERIKLLTGLASLKSFKYPIPLSSKLVESSILLIAKHAMK